MSARSLYARLAIGLAALAALLAAAGTAAADPIHDAVIGGDTEAVARLLREDSRVASAPDESHQYHYMPLHFAAQHGHLEIARLLLDAGVAVDCGDSDRSTPLDIAGLTRQPEMVTLLLERGADVNHRDNHGGYPLSFAASGGDSTAVELVLAAGADLNYENEQGVTLLHFAASRGLLKLAEVLLARDADPNATTTNGDTPLHWLGYSGRPEMIALLLEHDANPLPVNAEGETPLNRLAFGGHVDAARLLLAENGNAGGCDGYGRTALHAAAMRGHADFVSLLLEHEVNIDHQNSRGWTALHRAAMEGHADVADLLIGAGAKLGVRDGRNGRTALHWAAVQGYGDVAAALVNASAPLDYTDDYARTPLYYASCYAHKDLSKQLQRAGAKLGKHAARHCALGDQRGPKSEEALIWYLGHSAWAIKTEDHLMVFDYFPIERGPDQPGLCNGRISPAELAGENVSVFVSHVHGDHYTPQIFEWRDALPDVHYLFGFQPEEATGYEYLPPRQVRTIDGMKITTIESNDSGVGFVVEVDGLTIYHAGDHANRQRDFSGPYSAEIDWLQSQGIQPDVAFMPISGCGFGDQVAVKMGVEYALDVLQPTIFLPMHAGTDGQRYVEFIEECRDRHPQTRMVCAHNLGDFFRFSRGEIELIAANE